MVKLLYHTKKILETENSYGEKFFYVILIPHRDALIQLSAYREKLFSIGMHGAHSFPRAAPLARVSRPLGREELKGLAAAIRGLTKGNDGKITSGKPSLVHDDSAFSFFGPALNLPANEGIFPLSVSPVILKSLLPPVLCAALVGPGEISKNPIPEEMQSVSFRAAALANLFVRPLTIGDPDYSIRWETSLPIWLPAHRKER